MADSICADNLMEHILINYRWIFVITFLLPLSLLYQIWDYLRNYVIFWMNSAPKQHDRKVANVQKQIIAWRNSGMKTPMCTGRPGWQTMSFRRPLYKDTHFKVHIDLVDVLQVDCQKMTVRVEPLVTMGQLSATLLPLGFTLPVLPEMDDLTVGGLVMGTGVESSSHIFGLFQHTCVSFELILADASVVTCTKDDNPDLFYSVPWSYGSLGFLTCVEIRIIPAKKYVRLQYQTVKSQDDALRVFNWESNKPRPSNFVEGIMFGKHEGVIMTGDMVDSPGQDGMINYIGDWYKPWFFTHVRKAKPGLIEYIPLRHYYHRHTKSIFWELQDIIPFGNNVLFRVFLGWLMPPKVSLLKITQTQAVKKLYEKCHVIQDMLVPMDCIKPALEKFHTEIEVYPVWLCPFKLPRQPGLLKLGGDIKADYQMYVDIGVYGVPKAESYETVKSTRNIEEFVSKNHGFQMLYADTYTSREEFREMFDHTLYDVMRKRLDCQHAFPEIYDKVSRNARV